MSNKTQGTGRKHKHLAQPERGNKHPDNMRQAVETREYKGTQPKSDQCSKLGIDLMQKRFLNQSSI